MVRIPWQGDRLVVDGEIPDNGVVVALDAVAAFAHVVVRPPPAELRTLHGELTDELGQQWIIGMPAGVHPQYGDVLARHGFPVRIFPNFAVYAGTKAYVSHLSRTLRAELGAKNVRVSVIEPGLVTTELQGHVTDEASLEWLDGAKDALTWLAPEDIAESIAFLVAQPAHVNFQQLTIMPTAQPS